MAHLNTKVWLDEHLAELTYWQQDAFRQFTSMIADPEGKYPCIPGRQGFLSNHLRFGFVADPRSEESAIEVAQLLRQYGECSRDTGKYASLVLFLKLRKIWRKVSPLRNMRICSGPFWAASVRWTRCPGRMKFLQIPPILRGSSALMGTRISRSAQPRHMSCGEAAIPLILSLPFSRVGYLRILTILPHLGAI